NILFIRFCPIGTPRCINKTTKPRCINKTNKFKAQTVTASLPEPLSIHIHHGATTRRRTTALATSRGTDSESNSHPVYNSTVINLGQTLHASAKPPRVVTLDLLRGLIMMLQSIDRMWFCLVLCGYG
ncbi:hypothetical protein BC938DRAFT_477856, partial [Jimgerdemannia flammicorona]